MKTTLTALESTLDGQAIGVLAIGLMLLGMLLKGGQTTRFSALFFAFAFAALTAYTAFGIYALDAVGKSDLKAANEYNYLSYKIQALIVSFSAIFGGLSGNLFILYLTKHGENFWGIEKATHQADYINLMIEILSDKMNKMDGEQQKGYLEGLRDAIRLCEALDSKSQRLKTLKLLDKLAAIELKAK